MIFVTGATGFVGRHIVHRLLARGESVRGLARGSAHLPGADIVPGDVTDRGSLVGALTGCRAIIHLVGIIREVDGATFRRVHVQGTENVIDAAQAAGVTRLLHMSALGVRPDAGTGYYRSKWKAEELVRASGLQSTIFRPSVIFGPGSGFLKQLRDLLVGAPVVPIIGRGMSLLQPIWVEDVASCFVAALHDDETIGHTYQLAGPETYGFEQLLDLVAEAAGIDKPKLHLPVWLVRPAVAVLSRLSAKFPLTPDQLTMLLEDNVAEIAEMRRTFALDPAPLTQHLSD